MRTTRRVKRLSKPIRVMLWGMGIGLSWNVLVHWAGLALLVGYIALLGWACQSEKESVMLS